MTRYIYPDQYFQTKPIESILGSFHSHVEPKIAPMLVTGSYVSWIINISLRYLEAGRFSKHYMSPYLTSQEGLEAVYRYAEYYQQPLTNETAILLNKRCLSDLFFISCVMQSDYEDKQLGTVEGVINLVDYEITTDESELSEIWGEYIEGTLPKINDVHSKHMLLHLSKHNDRPWTPTEIKEALQLDMSNKEIQQKLKLMGQADLLSRGGSDIQFRGLQDGTLYLVLPHRFEQEITNFVPDLREDLRAEVTALQRDKARLQGMLNNLAGQMAEYQLATKFRSQKRFALAAYFKGVADKTQLSILDVRQGVKFQRPDGKLQEIDVVAKFRCGRVILVEVKKWQTAVGLKVVEDFQDKVLSYSAQYREQNVLAAVLSLGGFVEEAKLFCEREGIGMAQTMAWL